MLKRWLPRPPLASVVVIFLNGEPFLAEAIDSVLAQTYRPIEIFLVDDGSTDNSRAIAEGYASRHSFIRVLHHEGGANRGSSASRNLGLAHCRGRFVSFLDADDVWLPEKLEHEISLLRRHRSAAGIASASLVWTSWTEDPDVLSRILHPAVGSSEERPRDAPRYIARKKYEGVVPPPRLLRRHLSFRDGLPTITASLLRTRAARSVGGFEESFPGMYDDQVFFSKVAARYPLVVSHTCVALYRQHPDSMCNRARFSGEWQAQPGGLSSTYERYLKWLEAYVMENQPKERRLLKAVRGQVRRQEAGARGDGEAGERGAERPSER